MDWSVLHTGAIDKLKEGKKKVVRPPNPKGSKGGTRKKKL